MRLNKEKLEIIAKIVKKLKAMATQMSILEFEQWESSFNPKGGAK
jgi:hypothetical protein